MTIEIKAVFDKLFDKNIDDVVDVFIVYCDYMREVRLKCYWQLDM